MLNALFFSFCLDTKRNKKIKTNLMAPPVLSCRRTGEEGRRVRVEK
jgi:hypothetical protein